MLDAIPKEFLTELSGVFLLGGTARQRQLKKITFGMYSGNRIFLFALPTHTLAQQWSKVPKPSQAKEYTKFGATFTPAAKGYGHADIRRVQSPAVLSVQRVASRGRASCR